MQGQERQRIAEAELVHLLGRRNRFERRRIETCPADARTSASTENAGPARLPLRSRHLPRIASVAGLARRLVCAAGGRSLRRPPAAPFSREIPTPGSIFGVLNVRSAPPCGLPQDRQRSGVVRSGGERSQVRDEQRDILERRPLVFLEVQAQPPVRAPAGLGLLDKRTKA